MSARLTAHLLMAAVMGGAVLVSELRGDPCGMVPPIEWVNRDAAPPIVRIGAQRTYVFYRNGLETFVIRPAFRGRLDEFGMLIPFPTPPAIRKVPDGVFEHLAKAIDPPEVTIDLAPAPGFGGGFGGGGGVGGGGGFFGGGLGVELKKDEVRVVREEAIGMYEVAVLEAGSAAALKTWMDDHRYRFPEGMEDVCEEYVGRRWCFVAVRTRIGRKAGVEPKPGMRAADATLPPDAAFDGAVQAMGFRFRTRRLEVPMRLSAFNEGRLHNIVYLLAEDPAAIDAIDRRFVVRQLSGGQLFRNLTQPLPVRVLGARVERGRIINLTRAQLRSYDDERQPGPHNGHARDLFAADLIAVRDQTLALPHENREKQLANIAERLNLRGADVDALGHEALAEEREKDLADVLPALRSMTLTVIDGDFPRDVLARTNLTFHRFHMAERRNTPLRYDAVLGGPRKDDRRGILLQSSGLDVSPTRGSASHVASRPRSHGSSTAAVLMLLGATTVVAATVSCAFAVRRRRRRLG
ncbi:MAG: DUF2330 domain-containing protein [Planctomycetes bacterium]|nr:DUF2330 domain-containing protein [Planctomycetota bacterium]